MSKYIKILAAITLSMSSVLISSLAIAASQQASTLPDSEKIQFSHFDQLPFEKLSDKVSRHYITGSKAVLVYWKFAKGAVIPLQRHESEQITYIVKGKVLVKSGDKTYTVSAGDTIILPSNTPHIFTALEDTIDIDVFSPIRQDWFNGTANYKTGSIR